MSQLSSNYTAIAIYHVRGARLSESSEERERHLRLARLWRRDAADQRVIDRQIARGR